jgi:hypothetical protein
MPLNPESLYMQLGRLVETMPNLNLAGPLSADTQLWLARASALVREGGNYADAAMINTAVSQFYERHHSNIQTIISVVYRALARAELDAPATAQGAFIPAGHVFDGFNAVGKVLFGAKVAALIVDPYMDAKALTDFAILAPDGVPIRLLADAGKHKPTLEPAARRRTTQHTSRPLEVRLLPAHSLHDRLIVIDQKDVWVLGQSLNGFAVHAPTSIVRVVDAETAALKIEAYEGLWQAATPL